MGHADITTTMNIYAEATKEKKQQAMANLNGKMHHLLTISGSSLKGTGVSLKCVVNEAGLTDHGKTERRYAKPIIDRELEYWMKDNGLQPMYAALTGEN